MTFAIMINDVDTMKNFHDFDFKRGKSTQMILYT